MRGEVAPLRNGLFRASDDGYLQDRKHWPGLSCSDTKMVENGVGHLHLPVVLLKV